MGQLYRLDFASGKSYIGVSRVSAISRFLSHDKAAKNGADLLLSRAWRKHGAPQLRVLAIVENDDLLLAERLAVRAFGTMMPSGYNMTPGGDVQPTTVPEIAAKVAVKLRGKKKSLEHAANISIARRRPEVRAKFSGSNSPTRRPEVAARISATMKGRSFTDEHRANLSRKRATAETRTKMSASKMGHRVSSETREKISASIKGRVLSQEHKSKISAGMRMYRQELRNAS
ncbi:MAG: NUMOD3 domain-containing DNA-binding protein [Hyphomicrobiales bacterium]|nr:NUMOD3 domain-containing DNA-binding protein [Hyphomicrobiales bacterium]